MVLGRLRQETGVSQHEGCLAKSWTQNIPLPPPPTLTPAVFKDILCLSPSSHLQKKIRPWQNHHLAPILTAALAPKGQVRDSMFSTVTDCSSSPAKSCTQATLALGRVPTSRGTSSSTRAWAIAVHRIGLAAGECCHPGDNTSSSSACHML